MVGCPPGTKAGLGKVRGFLAIATIGGAGWGVDYR